MRSVKTKLLLEIGGKPIVKRVVEACEIPAINRIYLIVGYRADEVMQTLEDRYSYIFQRELLGTAHDLMKRRGFSNSDLRSDAK